MAKPAPTKMVTCEKCSNPHKLCLRDREAHYAALERKSGNSDEGDEGGKSRPHNPKRESRRQGEGPEARKRRNGSR